MFGAVQAKQMTAVGKTADLIANALLKRREANDKAAHDEAINAFNQDAPLYQEKEVYSKIGKDATEEVVKTASEYYRKRIGELSGKMRTPELQRQLAADLQRHANAYQKVAARHIGNEEKKWQQQVAYENLQTEYHSVIFLARSQDTEEADINFNHFVVPKIHELAKSKGMPVKEAERKIRYDFYNAVISHALKGGDADRAKGLLEDWVEHMDPAQSADLNASIKKQRSDDQAQVIAERLISGPNMTYADAEETINGIEDDYTRKKTRTYYNNYKSVQKSMETKQYESAVDTHVTQLDTMAGDLMAQQQYVDDLPDSTQNERKIKNKAKARLALYKAAKGLKPTTDLVKFDEATQGILDGKYTTESQIKAEFGDSIEYEDIKTDLLPMLKDAQKTTVTDMNTVYGFAKGQKGEPKLKLSKKEQQDRAAFTRWALQKVKESNRAKDPDYLQSLADLWVLKGKWTNDDWLSKEIQTYGTLVKKGEQEFWIHPEAQKYFGQETEDIQYQWRNAYQDNEEAMLEAYSRKLINALIGPKGKK